MIRSAAANDPFLGNNPPTVSWEGFQAEPFVLKNHEQVRAVLADAHKAVFGAALEDKTSTGTADNRFFGLYAGIPALVYGPQSDDIHGFDERVNLDSGSQDYPSDSSVHRRMVWSFKGLERTLEYYRVVDAD